jgi:hypothetical protein
MSRVFNRTVKGAVVALLLTGAVALPSAGAAIHAAAVSRVPGRSVTITQADNGRHYTLVLGERLTVRLSGPSSERWMAPTSSSPKVLVRRSASSGTTATATFQAVAAGKALVTAVHTPRCNPQCGVVTPLTVPVEFHVSISVT